MLQVESLPSEPLGKPIKSVWQVLTHFNTYDVGTITFVVQIRNLKHREDQNFALVDMIVE